MRISDWSSDVCSSDLLDRPPHWFGHGAQKLDLAKRNSQAGPFKGQFDFARLFASGHCTPILILWIRSARRVGIAARASSSRSATNVSSFESRSEERRVGNEWVSTCRSRWSPDQSKKK